MGFDSLAAIATAGPNHLWSVVPIAGTTLRFVFCPPRRSGTCAVRWRKPLASSSSRVCKCRESADQSPPDAVSA
ncbi:hypothetical protein ACFFQF_10050 [Haladaptatus pallidirubidus]|uniref:hypothetical protein n=1 Tax=Haladaptatus pallidirubidus TaxID=1008152 RepID=UPI0035E4708E